MRKVAYSAIHKATKSLEKLKWVAIVREEKSKKQVTRKIYSLTREGLLWVLSQIPTLSTRSLAFNESAKPSPRSSKPAKSKSQRNLEARLFPAFDIRKTARKNTELFPVVFENWDFFKRIKVADRLFDGFPQAAMSTLCDYYHRSFPAEEFSSLDTLFAYYLYSVFIEGEACTSIPQEDQEKDNWFAKNRNRAMKMRDEGKDPRLRNIILTVTKDLEKNLSTKLEFIKSLATPQA
jgi:DNA-binding PadR family transcriptional regulator